MEMPLRGLPVRVDHLRDEPMLHWIRHLEIVRKDAVLQPLDASDLTAPTTNTSDIASLLATCVLECPVVAAARAS